MSSNIYIGLMSGTSMDAIDAVVARIDDAALHLLHLHSRPYSDELRIRLERAIRNQATPDEIGQLDRLVGEAFAACALDAIETAGIAASAVRAIGSHGQTIRHAPEGPEGFTLQIGDPNTIAERTGITTVADFRRRDLAAGGQGAPLAPAFHAWFFGAGTKHRALLNLGGIANLTLIPATETGQSTPALAGGFDTGPANTLLDGWFRQHQSGIYDADGRWARTGQVDQALLLRLLADPYFSRPAPKSTGREYFNLDWLAKHLAQHGQIAAADVQRTLLELTAVSVAQAFKSLPAAKLYLCGGGCRNGFLVERLCELMPDRAPQTTAALGLAPEAVEGAAFAWLARQTLTGRPGNLPASTGAAGPRILGAIYQA